ncbi:MAG: hypothetical protein A6F70_07410 [Cycloclasticus sp. symbiont of Bathymodiolus heckerae]|nr:MAG: hypothetical protein A6F70_07410 [Cycloclasticus sp. symbiont of Bathymodiolus heckerae]
MKYIVLVMLLLLASGCSEEQQNRISRLGVSWMEGDYRVTFYEGSHKKEWVVIGGKVTSDPQKGYYFFWVKEGGKKRYIQTPIARTVIEEL